MMEETELDEEKSRQRKILKEVVSGASHERKQKKILRQPVCTWEDAADHGDGERVASEKVFQSRKHEGDESGSLASLFSGQPFSFLPEGAKGSLDASAGPRHLTHARIASDGHEQKRIWFFFHWHNSSLANRTENSFQKPSDCRGVDRVWPQHRSALKQLLRHSHRRAVRAGKRTQPALV